MHFTLNQSYYNDGEKLLISNGAKLIPKYKGLISPNSQIIYFIDFLNK